MPDGFLLQKRILLLAPNAVVCAFYRTEPGSRGGLCRDETRSQRPQAIRLDCLANELAVGSWETEAGRDQGTSRARLLSRSHRSVSRRTDSQSCCVRA